MFFNSAYKRDLVRTLRYCLILIVALVFASYLISGLQLKNLLHAQNSAISLSLPALERSQKMEALLATITSHSSRVTAETSLYQLDHWSKLINQTSRHLEDAFTEQEEYYAKTKSTFTVTDSLSHLKGLTTIVGSIASLRREILILDLYINTAIKNLVANRKTYSSEAEPAHLDATARLHNTIDKASSISAADMEPFIQDVKSELSYQYSTVELSFRITNLMESISQVSSLLSAEEINNTRSKTELEIRNITQILAYLDNSGSKKTQARILASIRALSLGDDGLFDNASRKAQLVSRMGQEHLRYLDRAESLSKQVHEMVSDISSNTRKYSEEFKRSLLFTVILLLVVGALVLLIAISVVHFVIEKQLNRRIKLLTGAVADIADGITSRSIDVDGEDELGRMASSLQIFKANAIELRRSTNELEQFAYAASHDLKSPLIAIQNLVSWTLEDFHDELPEEATSNLQKLLSRAQRLSQLQTDLLEYSKMGIEQYDAQEVDLFSLIHEVRELVDPDKRCEVQISSEFSLIHTQQVPLRQVLTNLFGNSIKHCTDKPLEIEIVVKRFSDRMKIEFKDNGPGIESKYHEQVFTIFKTLQTKDKVEGSGLGLALVRKLVDRYGGTIFIISDPPRFSGTTFVFDWPMHVETHRVAA